MMSFADEVSMELRYLSDALAINFRNLAAPKSQSEFDSLLDRCSELLLRVHAVAGDGRAEIEVAKHAGPARWPDLA